MQNYVSQAYYACRGFWKELYETVSTIKAGVTEQSLEDTANHLYALREMEKLLEDSLKETRRTKRLLASVFCLATMRRQIETVETEYCSVRPKPRHLFDLPSKRRDNEEKFDRLLGYLGIPAEVIENEWVRPHWPELQKELRKRVSFGENVPCDPSKENVDFDVTIRRKDEI